MYISIEFSPKKGSPIGANKLENNNNSKYIYIATMVENVKWANEIKGPKLEG